MVLKPFRVFAVIMIVFFTQNQPTFYSEESEEHGLTKKMQLAAGHPAELLDDPSLDIVAEGVADPAEVFVHSGDIARHLDCSLEAARDALKRFEDAGIIRQHGDTNLRVNDEGRHVLLYRPVFDDPREVMRILYEMEGEKPPNFVVATEEVTPGQFEYVEGSRFRYVEDDSVVIDVARPEASGRSIQDHISDQLAEHGLAASSLKNFAYELRQEADLI